jgi:hypothetical protein
MKDGNKKATKVIKSEDYEEREQAVEIAEATLQQYKAEKPKDADKYSIVVRPGNDNRCNGSKVYCHCRQWCHYWQRTYSQNAIVEAGY